LLPQVAKTTGRTIIIEPVGAMSAKNTVIGVIVAALGAKLHPNFLSQEGNNLSIS
jgi:hypothetical protein